MLSVASAECIVPAARTVRPISAQLFQVVLVGEITSFQPNNEHRTTMEDSWCAYTPS